MADPKVKTQCLILPDNILKQKHGPLVTCRARNLSASSLKRTETGHCLSGQVGFARLIFTINRNYW